MSLALPDPMLPQPFVVQKVGRETPDTYTLTLKPASGIGGFPFLPGQFNMLYAGGVGEVPISISGDPARPDTLVHTVRVVGNVSRAICTQPKGAYIGVRGPFGTPWPVEEAKGKDVLIVVGGVGLAPLRPAIYYFLDHRAALGNFELIYGARTLQDLLFRSELERWRGRFDIRVHVTVDTAPPDWRGSVGVVTTVLPRARFNPAHTLALVCGPEIMMHFTLMELQDRGLQPEQIYVSMERNMKCGIGLCGHCQWGPLFICKDGPVFRYDKIKQWFEKREI
jgi:NAD(P)H-flavin reductase